MDQKLNSIFTTVFPLRIPKEEKTLLLDGIKTCKDHVIGIL